MILRRISRPPGRLLSAARPSQTRSGPSIGRLSQMRFHSIGSTHPPFAAGQRPQLPTARPSLPGVRTTVGRRTIFIQVEPTPNPDALKFLPNQRILPENINTPFIEYLNPRSTIAPPYPSPLAAQLMNVDGVKAVFYGADFITVTKEEDANWAHIKPEIFALTTEAITGGQSIVNIVEKKESAQDGQEAAGEGEVDSLAYDENDDEVVGMIKELLETRIRPAIQEDGGDIEFRGFEDGHVLLKLRGACRTCDSSTVTLKNGIEGMLMHYIEEVKGVTQVMDEEEEIAAKEFAKFEEKLRQQKGAVPPTSPGAGSIDHAP
ncbi:hypothetical protein N8I77_006152 [Diaporthe amygdali]|uniref:Scaffold protein Nfu/NifU N-terminal domain-containing protein n=1 Tax=Phomopsis amygdali TaxID=1214568 RepID=A0AAD9SFC1_PHOAM|nr:hypothetical protein N8I77_006152 [Diaporthe amygdali]